MLGEQVAVDNGAGALEGDKEAAVEEEAASRAHIDITYGRGTADAEGGKEMGVLAGAAGLGRTQEAIDQLVDEMRAAKGFDNKACAIDGKYAQLVAPLVNALALAAAEALGEGEEEFAKVVVGLVDFKGVGMEHMERLVLLVAGGGQQFVNNAEVGAVGIVNENVGAAGFLLFAFFT